MVKPLVLMLSLILTGCYSIPSQPDVTGCYDVKWCVVPEVKFQGVNVQGLAIQNKDGDYRTVLTPADDPYRCIAHEMKHVAEGDFHDPFTPNSDYCLRGWK